MPRLTEDERLHLLSGKIMLYFAESEEVSILQYIDNSDNYKPPIEHE